MCQCSKQMQHRSAFDEAKLAQTAQCLDAGASRKMPLGIKRRLKDERVCYLFMTTMLISLPPKATIWTVTQQGEISNHWRCQCSVGTVGESINQLNSSTCFHGSQERSRTVLGVELVSYSSAVPIHQQHTQLYSSGTCSWYANSSFCLWARLSVNIFSVSCILRIQFPGHSLQAFSQFLLLTGNVSERTEVQTQGILGKRANDMPPSELLRVGIVTFKRCQISLAP